jgi:hypothetical protein
MLAKHRGFWCKNTLEILCPRKMNFPLQHNVNDPVLLFLAKSSSSNWQIDSRDQNCRTEKVLAKLATSRKWTKMHADGDGKQSIYHSIDNRFLMPMSYRKVYYSRVGMLFGQNGILFGMKIRNAREENPSDAFWEESVTIENAPHNESHYFRSEQIQRVANTKLQK